MEQDMSPDEVQRAISAPGFDPYGPTRIYAIWHGQIVSIKSQRHVDRYACGADRLYSATQTSVPVRRA
jgi:hypothetical protein